jgi:small subunit ribosomal protein S4
MVRPGQHGARNRRKLSEYGVQLKEKQKVKFLYGILENQLHRLYKQASSNPTATGAALISLLERRLDNVVYRLGYAPTRASARQLVNHGHVLVNGNKMDIPSYQVKVDDLILLKDSGKNIPYIKELFDEAPSIPEWLDRQGPAGTVKRLPVRSDVVESIDEQLIIEFYSR